MHTGQKNSKKDIHFKEMMRKVDVQRQIVGASGFK